MSKLRQRFFVTGGTGFIGRRLVDVLRRELDADVTVLAHRTSPGALALSASGATFNFTPITDADGLAGAMRGHDAVFHLAYGRYGSAADMRSTTVNGTQALVDAALSSNVKRFINVSTAAVYFGAPDGLVDESAPRRRWGWGYSDEKLAAENVVRKATAARGLGGSVFQVAGVYGPGAETFITNPLRNMRRGIVVLPNYGDGIANMTYVDDVVQALILGLKDEAIGETFLIKGPGTVTRMEFHRRLEAMLGYDAVEGISTADVKAAIKSSGTWRATARVIPAALQALRSSEPFKSTVRQTPLMPIARAAKAHLLKEGNRNSRDPIGQVSLERSIELVPPRILPPEIIVDYLASRLEFSSAKAERVLGYAPSVNLDEGMIRTAEWIKWAKLVGPRYTAERPNF